MPAPLEPVAPQPSQSPDPAPQPGRGDLVREVALVKNGRRYVFRYSVGEEGRVMKSLSEMARDPACDLGWFDAALLSHQMGRGMEQELLDRLKA